MTHPFSFQGSLTQYWEVLYTEYQRLTAVLGRPPFEFMPSNPQKINEYVPKNGDEIIIYFRDEEHRHALLVVEAELLPDEDEEIVQVMIFPQGNSFEEPVKSAMSIWREIKSALKRAGRQEDATAHILDNAATLLVKPKKQGNSRYYYGIHGMLVKIAHRDYCLRQNGQSPSWSHKLQGTVDNKTANSIDKEVNGKIKGQWNIPSVSGDIFVNLLFQRYPEYEYLEAEWEELKKKEF